MHLRHRLCAHCGAYRGKTVIDVTQAVAKKQAKAKAKAKTTGSRG